jgi:hypothetical protein
MVKKMNSVFVVFHARETDNGVDSVKMIGAYSSRENSDLAVSRLIKQPGFRDFPDGFSIDEYEINKDHWLEGFGGPDPV